MREMGIATLSFLVQALLVAATTAALLGAIALAGHFVVWRGLAFPVDLRVGFGLLGGAVFLFALGWLAYRLAKRYFG
jgi:cytosine/uracil/thiamine/allantoin permease